MAINADKILLLVLSSDDSHYNLLESKWRTYMHRHPMIRAKFVKCDESSPISYESGDIFYVNMKDSVRPGVFWKIIKALEFYRGTYSLVFRTNLSSFIRLDEFYELSRNLPKTKLYAGVKAIDGVSFVSGAGCFFSPDIVDKLLELRESYDGEYDDVFIGKILSGIVNILPLSRYDITSNLYPTKDSLESHYHIRFKIDDNRSQEIPVFDHLYELFYG